MARTRYSAVTIAIDEVLAMASRVGELNAKSLSSAATAVVNEVADSTYDLARERITSGINLDDAYMRRRMVVEHAKVGSTSASITARGDRGAMTRLYTYDGQMVIVPRVTDTPSRSRGLLPIPSGMKQQGARVTVIRGNTKTLQSGFVLPLMQGKTLGEKYGIFRRNGNTITHLLGPSVYQLFAYQLPTVGKAATDDLTQKMLDRVNAALDKVLK